MRTNLRSLAAIALLVSIGCSYVLSTGQPIPVPILYENPSLVAIPNHEQAWEQIVDVVDDYFRVEGEQRVRLVGNVLTPGRIDTFPQGGATLLEPHRLDAVGPYNRWEGTLQSIRRYAQIYVNPVQGGFQVEVIVNKELEDLVQPEHATAGAATFRHDGAPKGRTDEVGEAQVALEWIPLGRDAALEQQILAELHARFGGIPIGPPPPAFF